MYYPKVCIKKVQSDCQIDVSPLAVLPLSLSTTQRNSEEERNKQAHHKRKDPFRLKISLFDVV
jgi:hypothetical protein